LAHGVNGGHRHACFSEVPKGRKSEPRAASKAKLTMTVNLAGAAAAWRAQLLRACETGELSPKFWV
jgi:hypothetical protein